jgi:hypothetical protein
MRISSIALGISIAAACTSISISADESEGQVHITKECSHYNGTAGSFCSITSSNIPAIPIGSTVYYTQSAVNPASAEGSVIALDSNVVLFVATGDWARGRCTLGTNGQGLCAFSDGVGQLAGFRARVAVAPTGGPNFSWIGRYSFTADDDR